MLHQNNVQSKSSAKKSVWAGDGGDDDGGDDGGGDDLSGLEMVGIEKGIAQQFRVNTFNLIAKREMNTDQVKITVLPPSSAISVY